MTISAIPSGNRIPTLRHIDSQILLAFFLCILITIVGLSIFNLQLRFNSLAENLKEEGYAIADLLSLSSRHHLMVSDLASLEHTLLQVLTNIDIIDIMITGNEGSVLSHAQRSSEGVIQPVYGSPDITPPGISHKHELLSNNSLIIWHPIQDVGLYGWIRIEFSLARHNSENVEIVIQSIIGILIALVVCFVAVRIFLKSRLQVLTKVTNIVEEMGRSSGPVIPMDNTTHESMMITTAINHASDALFHQRERINEDREHMETLLNSVPVAVLGVNIEGVCIFCNPLFIQLCGYDRHLASENEDILGKVFDNDKYGGAYAQLRSQIKLVLIAGKSIFVETQYKKIGGTLSPCDCWAHPIRNGDTIVGAVISFADTSKRKDAEKQRTVLQRQLQQSQKMQAIGQLTGGIAHDFNNILAAVSGYANLALENADKISSNKLHDYLQEICIGAARATDLVKKMLAFSRISKSDQRPINIADAVTELTKLIKPMLPSSMAITTEIAESTIGAIADPVQIQQVMMNLCLNARDAVDAEGKIIISVSSIHVDSIKCNACHENFSGKYSMLRVIDNGKGISAAELDKIFDPFFTTKEVGKGTGMGLSMVHGLVHDNAGHITVMSSPGRGSEFSIYIPFCDGSRVGAVGDIEHITQADSLTSFHKNSPHILIVDDEQSVARFMGELFEMSGYRISIETDSTEAFERFTSDPSNYDLLVTDQTMPGLSGYELAERMLRLRPDFPIILCTGYSEKISAEKAFQLGIKSYQHKPVDLGTLSRIVADLLAK